MRISLAPYLLFAFLVPDASAQESAEKSQLTSSPSVNEGDSMASLKPQAGLEIGYLPIVTQQGIE
jgi:hypothetical protein